jgi:two-component system LytT family response regulator
MPDCSILIADDESLARQAIKLQLANYDNIRIVAECSNGEQTLLQILEHQPDIIFLDIQMPGLSGLEVLSKLSNSYQPFIIFATAYDIYAIQAFDNDAVDYLLKPFSDERFDKAFQKAYKLWSDKQKQTPQTSGIVDRLKLLLEHVNSLTNTPVTVTIKDGSKIFIIDSSDILFIESQGNYSSVVTKERKYLYKETLSALEELLSTVGFIRIHKSYIVNRSYIKELHSHYNGDYTVLLKTGHELKLSRNYREQLLHLLK